MRLISAPRDGVVEKRDKNCPCLHTILASTGKDTALDTSPTQTEKPMPAQKAAPEKAGAPIPAQASPAKPQHRYALAIEVFVSKESASRATTFYYKENSYIVFIQGSQGTNALVKWANNS
jgi:hypothetical protein